MFQKSASTRHKNEIDVTITLKDGDKFEAALFAKNEERLIDLLNDDRKFIPVKRLDGATLIIAKSSVASILEINPPERNATPARPGDKIADPYKILRVAPDASFDEIRRAYKSRLKAVHPDSVAGLELDEELTRAAHLATQKLNRAYKLIMQQREAEAAKGGSCDKSDGAAA